MQLPLSLSLAAEGEKCRNNNNLQSNYDPQSLRDNNADPSSDSLISLAIAAGRCERPESFPSRERKPKFPTFDLDARRASGATTSLSG